MSDEKHVAVTVLNTDPHARIALQMHHYFNKPPLLPRQGEFMKFADGKDGVVGKVMRIVHYCGWFNIYMYVAVTTEEAQRLMEYNEKQRGCTADEYLFKRDDAEWQSL